MKSGFFYFLTDEYCDRFRPYEVMSNKEKGHGRPCYYAIEDLDDSNIMWMIPISSRVEKYRRIDQEKKTKYKISVNNGLEFGAVQGRKCVFLLQNLCPVLTKDIESQYIDKNTNKPIRISNNTKRKVVNKARKLIDISKMGKRCTMTNIPKILAELKK